jgi:hypothetical protein
MSDYGEAEAEVEVDDFDDFDPLALDGDGDGEGEGEGDAEETTTDKVPILEDEEGEGEEEESESGDEDAPANLGPSSQNTKSRRTAGTLHCDEDSSRALVVVAREDRRTSNRMTLAEFTQACATRATIIAKSATVYVGVEAVEYTDAISLAEREIRERKSPLVCIREVGFTSKGERIVEQWKVNEMSLPAFN